MMAASDYVSWLPVCAANFFTYLINAVSASMQGYILCSAFAQTIPLSLVLNFMDIVIILSQPHGHEVEVNLAVHCS